MFRKILRFCEDVWLQVRDGKTNGKNLFHFSNIKLFVLYFGIVDYTYTVEDDAKSKKCPTFSDPFL